MLKFYCALAVTLQCLSAVVVAVQPLKIISIVSNSSGVDTPLWGRGEELIPGALLAAQQVNSNEDILNGFHIEVVPLFVQDCSVSEGILKTVQELLSTDHPVISVTGLFCPTLVKALSPLLSQKKINVIQLLGATIVDSVIAEDQSSNTVPGIQTPIKALFDLLEVLNWSDFKLVSIRSRTPLEDYYAETGRIITSRAMMKSNPLVLLERMDSSIRETLELLRYTSRIIIAILPPETAADLLCHAYKNKMTWPRYGWIMLDLTVSESAQCGGESLLRAMENVIVLKSKLEQNNNLTLSSNITYSNYVEKAKQHSPSTTTHNPYTNVLYDSVWALAIAVNSSLQALQHDKVNLTLTAKTVYGTLDNKTIQLLKERLLETTFTGASGEFKYGYIQSSVEIYQIQNESFITVGNRYSHDNATLFQPDLLSEIRPQDEIPRVYQFIPDAITITVSVAVSLCIIFTTVVLVIFCCSWRQPEVRASSRVLSLCIFLGSYLLLFGSLTDNIFASVYVDPGGVPVCIIIISLVFVGIDLILATVLAKTLRLAYIFNKFKKLGSVCSDYALFAMIALIVGGKAFLLIVWNAIDVNHIVDIPNPKLVINDDGFLQYNVFQHCYSEYQLVWVALTIVYTLFICLALVLVSYITRKIRRANYKDTKKINAFLFTALIVILPTIALWWVFRFVGLYQASTIASTVGYSSAPILCQVFLIIPKIGPGLKRHCYSIWK